MPVVMVRKLEDETIESNTPPNTQEGEIATRQTMKVTHYNFNFEALLALFFYQYHLY